jgi:type IV secretion system protein VirB1
MDFIALAQQCAPTVAPETMEALVRVESSFNPYAIGVVGGALVRQPKSLAEAVATVAALEEGGRNFSVGLAQVNRHNLPKYGLDYERAFEPCTNLRVGSRILEDCFTRATRSMQGQQALQAALSCYYSGNLSRGFLSDAPGTPSYVRKVLAAVGFGAAGVASTDPKATQSLPGSALDNQDTKQAVMVYR